MKSYGKQLRELWSASTIVMPGVFNPLVGMAARNNGFKAIYFSGGAFSASLGLPDIGLTTLSELVDQVRSIVQATGLPILVDADTGFGESVNAFRTTQLLEEAGAAGIHLEDQVLPKRCGHLEHKELISIEEMSSKIKAASHAKSDPDFLIMARTDARAIEGLEGSIKRGAAYLSAGAGALFPEGLTSKEEYETFAKAFPKTPLLANMTEFGKTPFIKVDEFAELGFKMVIFPVTLLRLAMKGVESGLQVIQREGSQESLIDQMQTRKELYELIDYDRYVKLDKRVKYK